MNDHPFFATMRRYYEGCSTGQVDEIESTLTSDAVHYFVDQPPIRGARELARLWAAVHERTNARWVLNHAIAGGDEAVAEWTMTWIPPAQKQREILRGTEWCVFHDGRISEIRAYYNNRHTRNPYNHELQEFPYEARGYTSGE